MLHTDQGSDFKGVAKEGEITFLDETGSWANFHAFIQGLDGSMQATCMG